MAFLKHRGQQFTPKGRRKNAECRILHSAFLILPFLMLCISQSEEKSLNEILSSLKGRNILTVSDTDGFARQGGIIRFFTEKNKIRFQINTDAAKAAKLTISSKLLRIAELADAR